MELEVIRRLDLICALGANGVSAPDALAMTTSLDGVPSATLAPGLAVVYDRAAHMADLNQRLRDAAESTVARRRGRPPQRA